jgi:PKD repeat protein
MKNKILSLVLLFISISCYPNGISTITPHNNYYSPTFNVTFSWNEVLNSTSYRLKIASDSSFTTLLKDTIINQSTVQVSLPVLSYVFWKVSANSNAYVESEGQRLNFMSPAQSNNILVWWAGDSNVVIQPDSTVSTWNNIIPNGINAQQPTSISRPKLVTVPELANKNVLRFDGVDDYVETSTGGLTGNSYVLCNWRGNNSVLPNYNGLFTRKTELLATDLFFGGQQGSLQLYPAGYYGTNIYMNNVLSTTLAPPLIKYRIISGRKIGTIANVTDFNLGREPFSAASRSWNGDVAELIVSKISTASESDSIHAYLYNKYAPPVSLGKDIIAGSTFSDSITLHAGVRFASYLWSTGGVDSIVRVATAGKYTVKTKDIFGFDSEDDILVYPYRRLNNINVYLCAGDSLVVDLGISSPFTFLWSNGSVANKITVKTTGQYTVRITDSRSRSVSDTVNVFISSPALSPPIPPSNNINLCKNEKLFVTTLSSLDSIRWSTGSTAHFISVTDSGTYSVSARSVNGCLLNKTFHVNIAGNAPVANFVNFTSCQNASTSFADSSVAPVGNSITNWKWSFGDGNTASGPNPSNIFNAAAPFTVSLKITTNVGCTDSIAKTIIVNKRPEARFIPRLSCSGLPTNFEDNSKPNATNIVDWTYNFDGLGVINHIQNPSFTFNTAGPHSVKLQVTNNIGCIDTITQVVHVSPSPVADFSFDSVCGRSAVNFKWEATVDPPAGINVYKWDFGDGTFDNVIKDAQHPYAAPGLYTVKLFVQSTDQCADTAEKQVRVFDFPVVDFTVSATQCTGKEIQFTDISATPDGTPMSKWNWFFSGQATSALQNPRYTFNAEGNYTVQLTATNSVGCSGTKLRSIAISDPPVPKFTFTPQNGLPPLTVSYFNQSAPTGNYIWDYGDNSGQVTAYNPPAHTYTVRGTFPIKLIATDFKGCTDTLTKYILVDRAFLDGVLATISISPNGDYYQVTITVINSSNIEIRDMGLSLQLGNGSVIRENWTGSLLPGKSLSYTFVGQVKLSDSQIPVICATIDNINNNSPEDRTDNNSSCKEIRVGQFDVLNVYPNPAYDNVNFGIMLPQDGTVSIGFVDYLGQIMYQKEFAGVKGYNKLTMNVMPLNSAVYVAVITYNGETIRKKLMRGDRN